jgi:hypothetical protein
MSLFLSPALRRQEPLDQPPNIYLPEVCKQQWAPDLAGDPLHRFLLQNKICADAELSPAYPSTPFSSLRSSTDDILFWTKVVFIMEGFLVPSMMFCSILFLLPRHQ